MGYVLVKHKVEDYDKWRQVFDSFEEYRKSKGEKLFQIYRNSEDTNEVFGLFEWENVESAKEFMGSDELKAKMKEAGVVGEPAIYFVEKA